MVGKPPKYPDQLLRPIVKPNGLLREEEARWQVFKWKVENLYCLLTRHANTRQIAQISPCLMRGGRAGFSRT